jgi:hypothetical protein
VKRREAQVAPAAAARRSNAASSTSPISITASVVSSSIFADECDAVKTMAKAVAQLAVADTADEPTLL